MTIVNEMNKIISYIMEKDNFIITSHVSPDGDNIGSSIAMTLYLKNLDKNCIHILDDEIPNNLQFLLSNYTIEKSEKILKIMDADEICKYTVIALDCANFDRLCIDQAFLDGNIINIDHHVSNENYGYLNYVNSEKSSTCEVLYEVINNLNKEHIDERIATALYTGLVTDTGNFKFDNVKQETFLMASQLLKNGAKKQSIIQNIYQNEKLNYLKFKSDLLLNRLEVVDKIAILTIDQTFLKKYSIDLKDTEDLVNYALDIENIEVAISLKEQYDGSTKGSLRSKSYIDVNSIANKLNGGGHKRAAGFKINKSIDETKKITLDLIGNIL